MKTTTALAIATGSLLVATVASAAPAVPSQERSNDPARTPCGYFETEHDAKYNHCSDTTRVVINVDTIWAPDYTKCVGPGVTYLGSTDDIRFASYVGRTC
ncbi:hypothetical protein IL38_07560 [Actinopolyspora erythraea]|uniref:Alpha-amlyase n=1 Tax=Actinopolyspora erythraea TaxID=414996 RepID=A0ABR4X677_9ACTN|nr:hypothetical protein IL38_07560 [Actinopolyspora erythraea]